jgi:hypothetical protein
MGQTLCCICGAKNTTKRVTRYNRLPDTSIIYKTFGVTCSECRSVSAGPLEMRMNKLQILFAFARSKAEKEIKA